MRRAGDILTELFRERFGRDFEEASRSGAGLFSSWDKIAAEVWPREEEALAAVHSQIRELERGVLLIEADHPGWVQILQTKKAEILSSVRRHYPDMDIKSLSFRLAREPWPSPGLNPESKAGTK